MVWQVSLLSSTQQAMYRVPRTKSVSTLLFLALSWHDSVASFYGIVPFPHAVYVRVVGRRTAFRKLMQVA